MAFTRVAPIGPAVSIPEKRIPEPKLKDALDTAVLEKHMEEVRKKEERAKAILDILEIPHTFIGNLSGTANIPAVQATILVDILMDEKKFKTLSSRVKNKAFW